MGIPCQGTNPHNNFGPEKTFGGQSTYIIPYQSDCYIAVFDVWDPSKSNWTVDTSFLPVEFKENKPSITWLDQWDLSRFSKE